MSPNKTPRLRVKRQSRRGFTLVEMMVAIAISSLVMSAVMTLQYLSGRAIKTTYAETRTRSSRMIALDQIRYRLCEAQVGSLSLSQANDDGPGFHRIEFDDPNLEGPTSAFFFNEDTDTLWYDSDISDAAGAIPVCEGPIDISFESLNAGAVVRLYVKSSADALFGDVDIEDGVTSVYLRNV